MDIADTPPKKKAPEISKSTKDVAKYFEIQIVDVAIKSLQKKEYLKSAMLSWSYIEEYFLPTFIKFIAKKQKVPIDNTFLENATAASLIKYYYLISYDKELYEILKEAKSLRNKLVHEAYRSGSLREVAKKSENSAKYNLTVAILAIFDRLDGKMVPPSLELYSRGWNDMRKEMKKRIEHRIAELKAELKP